MAASPLAFKGIALFTPGGDVIYCIDPHKQTRWHMHLCGALQHWIGLAEPPHFLVPCYTATIDRTVDSHTGRILDIVEASPLVVRYQPLLNAIFDVAGATWQPTSFEPDLCDPVVLATYRSQFPQLWESHDLVVRYEQTAPRSPSQPLTPSIAATSPASETPTEMRGYVLRLFVSGHSMVTQRAMQTLHHLLEELITQPYTLKVIDVAQHPEQAELDHITATPTLVRAYPLPVRRIVGNLDNVDQLLGVLSSLTDI